MKLSRRGVFKGAGAIGAGLIAGRSVPAPAAPALPFHPAEEPKRTRGHVYWRGMGWLLNQNMPATIEAKVLLLDEMYRFDGGHTLEELIASQVSLKNYRPQPMILQNDPEQRGYVAKPVTFHRLGTDRERPLGGIAVVIDTHPLAFLEAGGMRPNGGDVTIQWGPVVLQIKL